MGTSLTGLTPAATYQGLIKFGNNSAIAATAQYLSDGLGNDLPISVSTTKVGINTTNPTAKLQINESIGNNVLKIVRSDDTAQYFSVYMNTAPNLYDIGALADTANTILRFYNGAYIVTRVNNTEYIRQESNSVALFNGGTAGTARLQVKGSGSTSATSSLLIQNSGGTDLARLTDDGTYRVGNVTMSGQRFASAVGDLEFNLLGGYSMRFLSAGSEIGRYSWNGNWNFGTAYTPTAKVNIRTAGNSSATKAFLVENTYVTPMFCVNDAGQVSLQTSSPNVSALLQMDSTGQGFLPPRMTDAQVRAIATPAVGLTMYNTDLDCPVFYSSAGWRKISHSAM